VKIHQVLTNEFSVNYDEVGERLLIYTLKDGVKVSDVPISLKINMLSEMGADDAAKWVGQTLLLLIPAMRERVFGLPPEE
jgi:hypothetical protein